MKNHREIITSALFFAFTTLSGCDTEHLVDDRNDAYELDHDVELDAPGPPGRQQPEEDEMEHVTQEPPDGPDDFTDALDPSAASCVGYYNGGNFCLAKCLDDISTWAAVGHITNTSYGQCTAKVKSYCAWHGGTYGACWGWP